MQSALLEAMAERQVSVGGRTYPLPTPFLVMATQNPIESEGVYQLPEAQRDRFLLKVDVDHPTELEEFTILQRMSVDPPRARQVLTLDQVARAPARRRTPCSSTTPSRSTRWRSSWRPASRTASASGTSTGCVELGASPRATLGLVAAGRALALLRGRDYVLPGDVADVAGDVISHRLLLSFDAVADGVDPRDVVGAVLAAVAPPRVAPSQEPDGTYPPASAPHAEVATG